jgi:thioredoxin 1
MNTNSAQAKIEHELTVTDRSFGTEVLAGTQLVLVDLWAPWCGPCRMIAPMVNELTAEYAGRAKVVKLNVDENTETVARFGVASIPTLLIFKNGQLVDRVVGFTSKKTLTAKLDAHLN